MLLLCKILKVLLSCFLAMIASFIITFFRVGVTTMPLVLVTQNSVQQFSGSM